jgi:hypothetical protein
MQPVHGRFLVRYFIRTSIQQMKRALQGKGVTESSKFQLLLIMKITTDDLQQVEIKLQISILETGPGN